VFDPHHVAFLQSIAVRTVYNHAMYQMIAAALTLLLIAGATPAEEKRTTMSHRASGTFEVQIEAVSEKTRFLRHALDKKFAGDLEGTSEGEMMSVESAVQGSGAYVAIERVSGSLNGRKGTFTLIHKGTMQKGGNFKLDVNVVPDSGTEELTGLAGTMEIVIEGRNHFYHFEYTLH
jgi:hypothetical protein